jgi:hypothetical protein
MPKAPISFRGLPSRRLFTLRLGSLLLRRLLPLRFDSLPLRRLLLLRFDSLSFRRLLLLRFNSFPIPQQGSIALCILLTRFAVSALIPAELPFCRSHKSPSPLFVRPNNSSCYSLPMFPRPQQGSIALCILLTSFAVSALSPAELLATTHWFLLTSCYSLPMFPRPQQGSIALCIHLTSFAVSALSPVELLAKKTY